LDLPYGQRAKIENGAVAKYPYSFGQLRQDHPNVSFPPHPDDELLEKYGSFVVAKVTRPSGDVVTEGTPVLIGNQWTQVWEVRDFTDDENTSRLINAKEDKTAELNNKTNRVIFDYMVTQGLPVSDRNKYDSLTNQVDSATTVDQVENIDVENGW
jgi:hypothetical protein